MVGYRLIAWYINGKRHYLASGFHKAAAHFRPNDLDVDVKGRTYVVTGANSGIGFSAAKSIAAKGGTLHMICRSRERGEEARQEIMKETQNENVYLHVIDMADFKGLKSFADGFISKNDPIHVLVNNAGCMVHEKTLTEDGLESNFAVNVFGTYILTMLLADHMSKFDDPRVVTVSSGGMLLQKLNAEDPMLLKEKEFKADVCYSQHKRQQVVMTEEWGKMFPKVSFYTMHPGWADTPAVRSSLPEFYEKMKDDLRTPEQGADSMVWLALAKDIPSELKGGFIQDRESVSKHIPLAWTKNSQAEADALMQWLKNKAQELALLS
eukprot:m.26170 g.26170  ORF g.26170 m.26170 type:complete len:323 (-) comp11476_c3_seq1:36-1004(-)